MGLDVQDLAVAQVDLVVACTELDHAPIKGARRGTRGQKAAEPEGKINQKSKTPIEKQGSILKYKPPKDPKKLPEKSEQKTQPLITSETISKLQQNKPMPKAMPQSTTVPRISGRPQYVRQRGLANISGANISKNKTQTDHPRISGR